MAAPYKYQNYKAKVLMALIHLSKDYKTLWTNHARTYPDEAYD